MLKLNNYYLVDEMNFNELTYLFYESKTLGEYDTLIVLQETCQVLEERTFDELVYKFEEETYQSANYKQDDLFIQIISGWNMEESSFFHIYVNYKKFACDDDTSTDWRMVADFCHFYEIAPQKALGIVKCLILSGKYLYRNDDNDTLEIGYPAKYIFNRFGELKEV